MHWTSGWSSSSEQARLFFLSFLRRSPGISSRFCFQVSYVCAYLTICRSVSSSASTSDTLFPRSLPRGSCSQSHDNNRCIAIVLDSLVYSAPQVNGPILGGSSSITMGGSTSKAQGKADAEDLAGLLEAGSLPAAPIIVDEYSVGPSLGAQNIRNGLMSFVIALILIMIYMIFYYRGAGVVADISLIINLLLLIGALASLGSALTLPGIAGRCVLACWDPPF